MHGECLFALLSRLRCCYAFLEARRRCAFVEGEICYGHGGLVSLCVLRSVASTPQLPTRVGGGPCLCNRTISTE
ncbi:hypothetical protein IF2G_02964 [Cordyceps javanica]|nr:hypothetical protein IF2G_02964 [Cordyceps javanica]